MIEKGLPTYELSSWGWKEDENGISPIWMTIEEASKVCQELVKCGCKKKCEARCRCKSSSLNCTELCYCGGDC